MNLRDVLEPLPYLVHGGSADRQRPCRDAATVLERFQLLFGQWERALRPDDPPGSALAAEIICSEPLTVVVAAAILVSDPHAFASKQGRQAREAAARHAALRMEVLAGIGRSDHIATALRLGRLARRMSRWMQHLLEPVAARLERDAASNNEGHGAESKRRGHLRAALDTLALTRSVPNLSLNDPYRAALMTTILETVIGWIEWQSPGEPARGPAGQSHWMRRLRSGTGE